MSCAATLDYDGVTLTCDMCDEGTDSHPGVPTQAGTFTL